MERKSGDDHGCRPVEMWWWQSLRCAGRGRKTSERMCEGRYGGAGFAP